MSSPADRTLSPRADRTSAAASSPHTLPEAAGLRTEVQAVPLLAPSAVPGAAGYALGRELGRGGMGAVYAAYDPVLDREVAIKVMHPGGDGARFVVESKVTAQLPHPGVPPVYALGTLPDGRPFLAMKLVQGRTLATAIDGDLSDLLAAFERICETVGFAHSRGFVHRDLKPQNVMVGAHGEVLVMDWGLAKKLRIEDSDPAAGPSFHPQSAIRNPQSLETTAGAVKGTPAYMAPEQARGEEVDARADVFALGGILAAILTGRPPFMGKTVLDTVMKAARGELDECVARLDGCGEDAALVAIARRALAPDPADRYATGTEVADAIADYRADVQERLARAERERAVAAAEAREAHKRRRVQRRLAAAVLALVVGAAAVAAWQLNARAARARKAEVAAAERKYETERAERGAADALDLAARLRGQLKFAEADRTLNQARGAPLVGPDLAAQIDAARADTRFAQDLDTIRYRKWEWVARTELSGGFDEKSAPGLYEAAFAARGLRPRDADPAALARAVAASPIAPELVAALDDWALFEPDTATRARLLDVARRADPDPWRNRLRDPAARADRAALDELARTARPDTTPPAALAALAMLMSHAGLDPAPMLAAARAVHPDDFALAFSLGLWFDGRKEHARSTGPYEAARAIRPDSGSARNNLGVAYFQIGDLPAAVAIFRENARRDPTSAVAHNNLGGALHAQNDFAGAAAAFRDLVRLIPNDGQAHSHLGTALAEGGRFEEGIAANLRACELAPRSAKCRTNLAVAYRLKGDYPRALAAYRESVELDPTDVFARNSFARLWKAVGDEAAAIQEYKVALRIDPSYPHALGNLGEAYYQVGDYASAIATLREALRVAPNVPATYLNMGNAYRESGDTNAAVRAFNTAIRLDPNYASAYTNLGNIYQRRGAHADAVAAHQAAVARDPNLAVAHFNLANALYAGGDTDAALAAFRKAAVLFQKARDPNLSAAHVGSGMVLKARGDFSDAADAFAEAARIEPRNANAHANLADVYFRLERYEDAAASAERAVALVPTFALGHAIVGRSRAHLGDPDGARAALTVAARLDPDAWTETLIKLPRFPLAPPPRPVESP